MNTTRRRRITKNHTKGTSENQPPTPKILKSLQKFKESTSRMFSIIIPSEKFYKGLLMNFLAKSCLSIEVGVLVPFCGRKDFFKENL
jgi:hypothetical protein